jgi:hypothetical protein
LVRGPQKAAVLLDDELVDELRMARILRALRG